MLIADEAVHTGPVITGSIVVGAALLTAAAYEWRRRTGRKVVPYGRWVPPILAFQGLSQILAFRPGSWIAALGIIVWAIATGAATVKAEDVEVSTKEASPFS